MKTTLPKLLLAIVSLVTMQTGQARSVVTNSLPAIHRQGDSIFIQKQMTSKAHKISLYTDASQKAVFFSVKGEEGRVYQLYIFDLEGQLVRQTEIRNRQTTVLTELGKGVYVFDVFSDDLKIGNGQMTVR